MGIFTPQFAAAETRDAVDWLHDDDAMFDGPPTAAGVRVTQSSAMRLSTVWGCVRLLSNTISTAPTDLIVRIGTARFPEFRKPSWLVMPNPNDPSLTWTEHVGQVAVSLLLDGNFFVHVYPYVLDPQVLTVIPPSRVRVKTGPLYDILDEAGRVVRTVGPMEMLHGTWVRMPGAVRGISPIEAARQGIGAGLATEDFGARFFGQGSALSFGVEYPGKMDKQKLDDFREQMAKNYASSKKSHAVGILTDGAKFVTGLGITNEQAQFLDTRRFTVEDIAGRIFGIPPHKMGSQEAGASSYNSVEIRNLDYRQDAVLPLARRIEDPYNRLVEVPDTIRDPNATADFRFNLDGIARADLKTRADAAKSFVEGGIKTPNEARALEDLPPLTGGERIYMQQQMVPVGTQLAEEAA